MFAALGLLAVGATVIVRVDVAEDLSAATAHEVATQLAHQIEQRIGARALPETRPTGGCSIDEKVCVADIQQRTQADQVVIIRHYRAVSTIGLFAQIAGGGLRAKAELELAPSSWKDPLAALVAALYPKQPARERSVAEAEPPPPPPIAEESTAAFPYGPVISFGVAGALLASAITLFATAERRRSDVDREIEAATIDGVIYGISYSEASRRYDAVNADVWSGIGISIGAAVVAIGGIIWWVMTE